MEKQSQSLEKALVNSQCSKCGCTGLHACTGKPIVWTQEDKDKLKQALASMFGWDKNGKDD